jgi:hypothetical protein
VRESARAAREREGERERSTGRRADRQSEACSGDGCGRAARGRVDGCCSLHAHRTIGAGCEGRVISVIHAHTLINISPSNRSRGSPGRAGRHQSCSCRQCGSCRPLRPPCSRSYSPATTTPSPSNKHASKALMSDSAARPPLIRWSVAAPLGTSRQTAPVGGRRDRHP